MKLESLKEEKFKNATLKKEQMFMLNGGGTATPGGSGCGSGVSAAFPNKIYRFDFGYDIDRGNGWITYHNRTNVSVISAEECATLQGL